MAAPTVPFSEYAPKVATIKPDFTFRFGGRRLAPAEFASAQPRA